MIRDLLLIICAATSLSAAEVKLTIADQESGRPMAARIHLLDAEGKPQRPPGYPFWRDHFVCDGNTRMSLENGRYSYTVERGPEFKSASGEFQLSTDSTNIAVRLKRIANLASEGYWSGETHVHRDLQDVELLMRAEDLHVTQVITWWNARTTQAPAEAIKTFDNKTRSYHLTSGEDERDGGALLFCDLSRPLDITAGQQHFPSSLVYARQARAAGAKWIDVEKPFWWDFPMWLANGVADTVGIANNHMNRSGMYENEAWGKPRDTTKYPAPLGNALWTQQIYYHALNCGLHLPPSAGSASGVLPNPVGYNRAYVHIDGPFTYEKWRDGLLAGRSFVSNGPLLRCQANGEYPGHIFKSVEPLTLHIDGRFDSSDPIKAFELVRNGQAMPVTLPATIRVESSGWFLVRAICDVTNTFRFASTAPWYVEIGGGLLPIQKSSAQFFVDWCRERSAIIRKNEKLTIAQKEEVLGPWSAATQFWETKLAAAR